jgi:dextranase
LLVFLVAGGLVLVLGLRPDPGHAATMPSLDPATHPYIRLISTQKAVYAPGESGKVLITLRNPGASALKVRVVTTIHFNTAMLHEATDSASIEASSSATVTVPFTAPVAGERGYRLAVTVKNMDGAIVDTAAGAIDVQSSRLHVRFPRQCWISHWDGEVDAVSLIASQVAWHCNTIQSYASYYRPELAPPASLDEWRSLSNLPIRRAAIRNTIAAAHAAGMPIGFFQATGEAYSDWPTQAVRPQLAWGSFRNRCGLAGKCTADDMDQSPALPENWTKYGWQADHLDFFDPCSKGWQTFLLSRSIKPMMEQFAFDFWQADTVGAPVQPTFDAQGRPLDTVRCLADFTSAAQERLGKPAVLNTVSGWGLDDAAGQGRQPYLYRETWDFDTPYYPGLNGIVASTVEAMRKGGSGHAGRAIVQPGYINRTLAQACSTHARTSGCTVNAPSALLATAMFAIAGSTWMNHPDQGCVATNVFVEGYHLPCAPGLIDALLSYKAFEVSYQNLLRDGTRDSNQPCQITTGAKGGTVGAAGEVYLLGKAQPGFQICHLLNLTGVSSNAWADLDGTKETPTKLGRIAMKLYYSGDPVRSGHNTLWWASPDHAAGAAQPLAYTTGADPSGRYVLFTLPELGYWDMVVLETGTAQ